jgi:L-2-hydroxyglutarate oxidase LhgO
MYLTLNEMIQDKLIEIKELMEILGYTDERTVVKWCKAHNVPLFGVGSRKYSISNFLEIFLENELRKFLQAKFKNPEEVLSAIKSDEKFEMAKLADSLSRKEVKSRFQVKQTKSKEAEAFLNKLKVA